MKIDFDNLTALDYVLDIVADAGLTSFVTVNYNIDSLSIVADNEEVYETLVSLINDDDELDAGGIVYNEADPGDMDGDHASALASAGYGTDEDYEHCSYDDGDF